MDKLSALYKLSRIGTIMDSFPLLMALAVLAARLELSWMVVLAIATNLLLLTFAYMVNDIGDAEDDSHDPAKKKRNPVASGRLSYLEANIATFAVVIFSAIVLVNYGLNVTLIGASILVVGFLYSWNPVRLKANPVVDILSHGYFLAAAQILFFAMLPGGTFDGLTIMMAAGVYVFSVGGDLYNEFRDWKVDQKAGLKNTASLLGYKLTRMVTFGFWIGGFALIAATCVLILGPKLGLF